MTPAEVRFRLQYWKEAYLVTQPACKAAGVMARRKLRGIYSIIIMVSVVCCTLFDAHSEQLFGVNLSGAEWGNRYTGTFGTDYTYPTASELDYYKSKGST